VSLSVVYKGSRPYRHLQVDSDHPSCQNWRPEYHNVMRFLAGVERGRGWGWGWGIGEYTLLSTTWSPSFPFVPPFSLKHTCRHIVKNSYELETSPLCLVQVGLWSAL